MTCDGCGHYRMTHAHIIAGEIRHLCAECGRSARYTDAGDGGQGPGAGYPATVEQTKSQTPDPRPPTAKRKRRRR